MKISLSLFIACIIYGIVTNKPPPEKGRVIVQHKHISLGSGTVYMYYKYICRDRVIREMTVEGEDMPHLSCEGES